MPFSSPSSFLFHFLKNFLQRRWLIWSSSQNWKMSNAVSIKPEPLDLPLCLESCLHLGWVTAVLTVLGWMRKCYRDLRCVTEWLNSVILPSQRRDTWKTDFSRAEFSNCQNGHSFSGLSKDNCVMCTHYSVYILNLKIHTSHRLAHTYHKYVHAIFCLQRSAKRVATMLLHREKRWEVH